MSTRVGRWTLTASLGRGRLGPLWLAIGPDGRRACVRHLDPRLLQPPGSRDRALALMRRLAAARHPGVVNVVDLLAVGEHWYLITDCIPGPALDDLLGGPGEPAAAVAVAVDLGRACAALHRAGLAHGSVAPSAVLIDAGGAARLAEPGLLATLTGTPLDPAADLHALADVVGSMRRAWAPEDGPVAAALDRYAERVAPERGSPDLVGLTADLERAVTARVPGWKARTGLRTGVAAWAGTQPPPAPGGEGDGMAATILDVPGADEQAAAARTLLEAPPPPAPTPTARIRIGAPPGTEEPAAAGLLDSVAPAAPVTPDWTTRTRSAPGRRRWPVLAVIGVAAVLVAACILLLTRGPAGTQLEIIHVTVTAQPAQAGCGQQVSVSGVVSTNGEPGEIRYRWQRNDGSPAGAVHDQVVESGQQTVELPLAWTITGGGGFTAVARLTILQPAGLQPFTGGFTYHC